METNCDRSFVDIPEGFSVGVVAYHERSHRLVKLKERQLGDGWLCEPLNGDRTFYEHSKYLKPYYICLSCGGTKFKNTHTNVWHCENCHSYFIDGLFCLYTPLHISKS